MAVVQGQRSVQREQRLASPQPGPPQYQTLTARGRTLVCSPASCLPVRPGWSWAPPGEPRGGRSKIYYILTPTGLKALERVNEFNRSLWKGIRDINEDYQI